MKLRTIKKRGLCPRCHMAGWAEPIWVKGTGRPIRKQVVFCGNCHWPSAPIRRWGKHRTEPPTFDDLEFSPHHTAVYMRLSNDFLKSMTAPVSMMMNAFETHQWSGVDFQNGIRASVCTEMELHPAIEDVSGLYEMALVKPDGEFLPLPDDEQVERFITPERVSELLRIGFEWSDHD